MPVLLFPFCLFSHPSPTFKRNLWQVIFSKNDPNNVSGPKCSSRITHQGVDLTSLPFEPKQNFLTNVLFKQVWWKLIFHYEWDVLLEMGYTGLCGDTQNSDDLAFFGLLTIQRPFSLWVNYVKAEYERKGTLFLGNKQMICLPHLS